MTKLPDIKKALETVEARRPSPCSLRVASAGFRVLPSSCSIPVGRLQLLISKQGTGTALNVDFELMDNVYAKASPSSGPLTPEVCIRLKPSCRLC